MKKVLTNSATKLVVSVSSTGSELLLSVRKKEEASVVLYVVISPHFIHFLHITSINHRGGTEKPHPPANKYILVCECDVVWTC